MVTLPSWIRWIAFAFGAVSILGGFAAASTPEGAAAGVMPIVFGAVTIIVAVLQHSRYRSSWAEARHLDSGPGGGEDGPLEPRFLATNEVFADPTSRRLMRVFVDPRTGERRYRAEG